MRSGGCALNQGLNTEAASVVKQAVALAKRRGHAQVTPLHVANTMLAVSGGLLRVACMQSHSHPLQCKALELCFNVALNRLPASSSSPILTHHSQYPSISNALVAAFKRAQAHQRRGSAEAPILAVKIELEQLIISILDDPSVSRVMREAGFSSTQVKSNVEKVVSLELKSNPKGDNDNNNNKNTNMSCTVDQNDDVDIIVQTMVTSSWRKRSFVVVGECISDIESRVKEVMYRVDKGGVPEDLRQVKFITIPPFYSFSNLNKDLVEQKMGEVSYLVNSLIGKGVVLYLGDLNWISEYRVNLERERERSYYCSVEHMIMEIGNLISGINGESGRFWVMGIATFQTYMRCRNGYMNSLEAIWRLNPLTLPANSLGLSLISQSNELHSGGDLEAEAEAQNLATLSSLPPWLKDESRRLCINNQKGDSITELSNKKPSSLERTLTLSSPSPSPSSSISCFSFDQHFSLSKIPTHESPSSTDDSGFGQRFKEFNAVNLNMLCNALEKKVPWQREIIPEIAGTILQCRSGMLKRKDKENEVKEETWLFFLGPDSHAKERMSKYLAKIVFGSYSNFVSIGINSDSEDYPNKRERRDGNGQRCSSYIERFAEAVSANPHRVFMVEDLERVDYWSQIRIKRAIESGRISNGVGEEVGLCDAIVVLSCDRFSCRSPPEGSPASSSSSRRNVVGEDDRILLDLNTSFNDDNVDQNQFVDDLGIVEFVDRLVLFKIMNF